jgi:hypothetical protein
MTTQSNNDRQNNRELSLDELEIVSAGDGKASSGTRTSSQTYMRYDFKQVFVTSIS